VEGTLSKLHGEGRHERCVQICSTNLDTVDTTRGITDILLITALTMSFVLLALRRWRLPFGTFAFMFGLNGALMVVFSPNSLLVSVPTALLGGLAADLVYRFLQPSLDQPASVRLFAFLVPAMFYALYFVDLAIHCGAGHFSRRHHLVRALLGGRAGDRRHCRFPAKLRHDPACASCRGEG
jgi:hypothetical protein